MIRVVLFTTSSCSRCDDVREKLNDLQQEIPHQLVDIDISEDPLLQREYGSSVPVIQVGPYTLEGSFTDRHLHVTLAAARDRERHKGTRKPTKRSRLIRLNKLARSLSRHWLALFNSLLFLYVSVPFLAAVFMNAGMVGPANLIYRIYSPLCHQLAYRSWFVFGEQSHYPLASEGMPLTSYEEISGLDEDDVFGAKAFIGNDEVGYKVAFCQRDVAIYGSMFLAGVVYAFSRDKIKPLPLLLWLLIGIVPMALDGGTQLLSSLPWFTLPLRESTPLLRTITGALFGITNVWMAYPYLQESMVEINLMATTNLLTAVSSTPDKAE